MTNPVDSVLGGIINLGRDYTTDGGTGSSSEGMMLINMIAKRVEIQISETPDDQLDILVSRVVLQDGGVFGAARIEIEGRNYHLISEDVAVAEKLGIVPRAVAKVTHIVYYGLNEELEEDFLINFKETLKVFKVGEPVMPDLIIKSTVEYLVTAFKRVA